MLSHDELDLGVIFVNEADVPSKIAPIPLLEKPIDEHWVDSAVEIAGFGITETGDAFVKRFAATEVQEVREGSVVVSSDGANGACVGDSGGPLLVRDDSGRITVVGILSAGHPSCLAHDRYVRVDQATSWWKDNGAISELADRGCDGVSRAGTCVRNNAVRCSTGDEEVDCSRCGQTCQEHLAGRVAGCVTP